MSQYINEEYKCTTCEKICKDKRGLTIHLKRCSSKDEPVCEFCEERFYSQRNLHRHQLICKDYKLHTQVIEHQAQTTRLKEEHAAYIFKLKEEHKLSITRMNEKFEYERQTNELRLNGYHDQCHTYESRIKDLEHQLHEGSQHLDNTIRDYTSRIAKLEKQLENERKDSKYYISKAIDGQAVARSATTNSHNNSHNNTTNNINIFKFDPSKIQGKLNHRIKSDDQFASFITKMLGDDYFRVTDRSRGNILWNDESGTQIKDSGGMALVTKICDVMKPDFIMQKENASKDLDKQNMSIDDINAAGEAIVYSNMVITKNKKCISKVGKKLGKYGKNSKDKLGVRTITSSTNLSEVQRAIERSLHDDFLTWIFKDKQSFGSFLYKIVSPFKTGQSDKIQTPWYIYVKGDNSLNVKVGPEEMAKLVSSSLYSLLYSDMSDVIQMLLGRYIDLAYTDFDENETVQTNVDAFFTLASVETITEFEPIFSSFVNEMRK